MKMEHNQCDYKNKTDAYFCRNYRIWSELIRKEKAMVRTEFELISHRRHEEHFLCFEQPKSETSGFVIEAIFIIVELFIGVVLIYPNFIGKFFNNLREGIENFFRKWGSNFIDAIGNFFDKIFNNIQWWIILQLTISSIFIFLDLVILISTHRKH